MKVAATKIAFITLLFLAAVSLPATITAQCIDGDCVNGHGTYAWPNGVKYTGAWNNGKPNGQGSFIWAEGDRYVGEWIYGRSIGPGHYTCPTDAKLYLVDLTDDEDRGPGCIQGDCVNGYGVFTWVSGAKYIGAFENGKRTGTGTYSFPNGRSIEGIWDNGRYVGRNSPRSLNREG